MKSKIFPTAPVGGPRGARGDGALADGGAPAEPPQHQTFQRLVGVYIPDGYVPNTPTPFIVEQDGQTYVNPEGNPVTDKAFMPPMLDNLIHEKRIPLIGAVLIAPGPGAQRPAPSARSNTIRFQMDGLHTCEVSQ